MEVVYEIQICVIDKYGKMLISKLKEGITIIT